MIGRCATMSGIRVTTSSASSPSLLLLLNNNNNIIRTKCWFSSFIVSRDNKVLTLNQNQKMTSFCFTTHATTNDSSDSPIDSSLISSMQRKIKEHLNAESVTVTDAYGDGRHVSISVVSSEFEGKSAVNRQRMVYKAIWEELQSTVHAVDHMSTKTPLESSSSDT